MLNLRPPALNGRDLFTSLNGERSCTRAWIEHFGATVDVRSNSTDQTIQFSTTDPMSDEAAPPVRVSLSLGDAEELAKFILSEIALLRMIPHYMSLVDPLREDDDL